VKTVGANNYLPLQRIDISHLPVGVYFIQIGNYTEKFVVVRWEINLDNVILNEVKNLVKIYNTFGECVITVGTNNYLPLQRIDISHLPVGVYFIQIGNYSKKFMVVRWEINLDNVILNEVKNLVKIYNTYGECVKTVGANNYLPLQRIDISHLPLGVYFIQIDIYTEKFMVVRWEINLDNVILNEVKNPVKIYNTFGECVKTVGANNYLPLQRIDISHLPVGVYFIQIGNYTKKFMVVRWEINLDNVILSEAKQSNQYLQHLRRMCDNRRDK
jgi:hypothetical protein